MRGEAYTGFWCGHLMLRDHLGDPGVDGSRILRWIFRKWEVNVKVKFTLEQATKAQMRIRGIALLFI
jgi:hypothetical protein